MTTLASVASQLRLPTLCPFRICTGHACPGCGLTRSIGALVRGDITLSLQYHPIGILIALQALIITADRIFVRRGREMTTPYGRTVMGAVIERYRWVMLANACLLVATWALRWKLGLLDFVVAT